MLYERTALSRKPKELAKQELTALKDEGRLSADLVFRDPYLLDFLGLKDTYSEADLEVATRPGTRKWNRRSRSVRGQLLCHVPHHLPKARDRRGPIQPVRSGVPNDRTVRITRRPREPDARAR